MDDFRPIQNIRRAWIFYELKLYDQALQEVQEALRILPSCAEAYIIRGKVYTRKHELSKAYEALRLAHIYSPKDSQTLISLGEFYLVKAEFDKALRIAKTITAEFPKFAKGYCLLAQTYIKQNKIQPASTAMKQAFKLDPKVSAYSKQLSDLLYGLKSN
ncbi:MAG: tetratricopeptide repeat protein [Candidatus Omnitrophica bacterium]|nr:tetratricopeptide repeat protein [Candidatus Omnitrophota bacterium]